ncbi:hypothetical protein G9A89_023636 [Geosiphon pyriformis]|nr:hypothetical protein G9A89_023636 [Geosiphon pyriformis]
MKQDTIQATLFELVYSRTAILPVEIEVNTYSAKPITEDNFQETLLRRVYDLMETLENKWQKTANNIQILQEKQKERHDNQLPEKPVEFKIGDKVLLHCTKAEKQWNRKFDPKWNRPFYIKKILENRSYKLKWDNKILAKAAHGNQLKPYYHIVLPSTSNILQLGVQRILVQPDKIPQNLEPIIIIRPNM